MLTSIWNNCSYQFDPFVHISLWIINSHQSNQMTWDVGNMREALCLPKGKDFNERLPVNTVDFFNEVSLLFCKITEYCTQETCSLTSAGPKCECS